MVWVKVNLSIHSYPLNFLSQSPCKAAKPFPEGGKIGAETHTQFSSFHDKRYTILCKIFYSLFLKAAKSLSVFICRYSWLFLYVANTHTTVHTLRLRRAREKPLCTGTSKASQGLPETSPGCCRSTRRARAAQDPVPSPPALARKRARNDTACPSPISGKAGCAPSAVGEAALPPARWTGSPLLGAAPRTFSPAYDTRLC